MSEQAITQGRTASDSGASSDIAIDEIALADEPGTWRALGFAVESDAVALGAIHLRLVGRDAGRGIVGWSLHGIAEEELDGLPTSISRQPRRPPAAEHPNGVVSIDHVVAFSPRLDRTVAALRSAGLTLLRVREQPTPAGAPRQAFFRLGEAIVEVVQIRQDEIARAGGEDASARFWGLALLSADLDRTVAALGEHVSEIRPAVQPGRRIATVKRSAGVAVPLALMSAPAA